MLAPPASADTASDEARVLTLIQQTRSSVGAPALRVDPALASAARAWAAKMARDGHDLPQRQHRVAGHRVEALRERRDGRDLDIVHQGFLNSPGHRANMVDTRVNSVGVGVAWANGYVYVVQDYAQLATPPSPANRAPNVPNQPTPANVSVLRTAPTQASARYSDPDGNSGRVFFAVLDETGQGRAPGVEPGRLQHLPGEPSPSPPFPTGSTG